MAGLESGVPIPKHHYIGYYNTERIHSAHRAYPGGLRENVLELSSGVINRLGVSHFELAPPAPAGLWNSRGY